MLLHMPWVFVHNRFFILMLTCSVHTCPGSQPPLHSSLAIAVVAILYLFHLHLLKDLPTHIPTPIFRLYIKLDVIWAGPTTWIEAPPPAIDPQSFSNDLLYSCRGKLITGRMCLTLLNCSCCWAALYSPPVYWPAHLSQERSNVHTTCGCNQ